MYPMSFMPDPGPLSEEDKEKLGALDRQIAIAEQQKLALIREIARRNGVSVATLGDFKSENGEPFTEESLGTRIHGLRTAVIMKETVTGRFGPVEEAYLCRPMYPGDGSDSCGWVRGKPIERGYDNIGLLAGSAGVRFFCRICGHQIAERRGMMS